MATIKFYLREKLLPAGVPTARNQAEYGDEHLRQLLLIRALTGIAQLDLSAVRALLIAIDDDDLSLPDLYRTADHAINGPDNDALEPEQIGHTRADIDDLLIEMGWESHTGSAAAGRLVQAAAALRLFGCGCGVEFFVPYAQAARDLAGREVDLVPEEIGPGVRAAAVVRSVLLAVASSALHRIAEEHVALSRAA